MVARDRGRNRNRMRNRERGGKKKNKNRCGDIKMKAMAKKGAAQHDTHVGVGVSWACLTV